MNDDFFYPRRHFAVVDDVFTRRETARLLILPVPYDATTSYRTGAREGPQAILDASQYVELYDRELDREPYRVGVHTLREVVPVLGRPEGMVDRLQTIAAELLTSGKFIASLGGDHLVSIGIIRAHAAAFPGLSILHLDAHADLYDEYEGSAFGSATVMRRTSEICPITQVGIRAMSQEEARFARERGIRQFFAEDIVGRFDWIPEVVESLADPVYVSIDVDFFDSSLMAATGTPEPGGPGWYEAVRLLREVTRRRQVVGFDVVELAPALGPHACAFLAAKLIYKLIGYVSEGWPEIPEAE